MVLPHTIVLAVASLLAEGDRLPQTIVFPKTRASEFDRLPQTMVFPVTVLDPQTIVLPHIRAPPY
jgi:hypothetical protein